MTVPAWLQHEWSADLAARQAGDWQAVERLADDARHEVYPRQRSMTWWPHMATAAPYWATVRRAVEDERTTGMAWPVSADATARAARAQLTYPRVPL